MSDAALIAEFLAAKGAKKIAVGTSSGITDRQWYKAARGEISLAPPTDDELIAMRERRGDAIFNGLGELIAIEPEDDGGARSEAVWQARMAGDMEAF